MDWCDKYISRYGILSWNLDSSSAVLLAQKGQDGLPAERRVWRMQLLHSISDYIVGVLHGKQCGILRAFLAGSTYVLRGSTVEKSPSDAWSMYTTSLRSIAVAA